MSAPQFGKTSTAQDDKTTTQHLGTASRFTPKPIGKSSRKERGTLHNGPGDVFCGIALKSFSGKYIKASIKPFKAYGMYRGKGSIEFTDGGFRISGSHVMSLGARWGIGLAIFFGCMILTVGAFAPGGILIYWIMEHVWLKKEATIVPYSNVISYIVNPKKRLVGIDYEGPSVV